MSDLEPLLPATVEESVLRINTDSVWLPDIKTDRIFRKAVQTIHSYPASGEPSATARKVSTALCVFVQDTFALLSEEHKRMIKDRTIRATPVFRIQIGRLKAMIEQSSNDNERIYDALDNLYEWSFHYNVMAEVQGETSLVGQFKSRFLSSLGKGVSAGLANGEISFEIPNDVLLMIVEPSIYAQIHLRVVNSLGSTHAIALYENCVRYLGTYKKLTAALPVQEWVNLLSGFGLYPDRYKDFKRFVLKPAMHILEKMDIIPFTVEILEAKNSRRKITHLQFKLHLKKQRGLAMDMPPPSWSASLVDLLKTVYSMSMSEIGNLSVMATEDEVKEAISRDSEMVKRKIAQGETIVDRAKYLKGILKNLQTGKKRDIEPEVDEEEIASKQLEQALEKIKKEKEKFASFQTKTILEKLTDLPASELGKLRDQFRIAHVDNQTLSRMIEKGWKNGSNALNGSFVAWIRSQPEIVKLFLNRREELEFEIWREMYGD